MKPETVSAWKNVGNDGLCALGLCQVKAVGLVQVNDLLFCYGKPLKPKNSSIYLCSRDHNIYRILYRTP